MSAPLRICVVFPDLLGTYGDGGNGLVLRERAMRRGIEATLVQAPSIEPLPDADLYCLGGGEDGPQVRAAELLRQGGDLDRRVRDGAVVLAVCAGFQLCGHRFPGTDGSLHQGLSLLDVDTIKVDAPRAVGEVVATVLGTALPGIPPLTGFENHAGRTRLGEGARPLASVEVGIGNGFDGVEGAIAERVLATYLHGPVLARNPAVADLLLSWALDRALEPLEVQSVAALRAERLAEARRS